MNYQFNPGARPEAKPANQDGEAVNRTPGAGGVIIFNRRPPLLTGTGNPQEVIEKGKIVGLEEFRKRALDAIGVPIPEKKDA